MNIARYVKTANLKEMRSGMRMKADERRRDVLGTPYTEYEPYAAMPEVTIIWPKT